MREKRDTVIQSFDDFCRELNGGGFSMGMFISMTGRKQKKNKYGIEYG